MKDVVIHINSIHAYDEGENDNLEFSTDGEFHFEDGVGYLRYMESEVTGMPGTETSMEIRPGEVVVDRRGGITSRMVFRLGERDSFQYETPYGMATMGMVTRRIDHAITEQGGKVEIDYVLDVEHAVVERNKFCLSVKEQ